MPLEKEVFLETLHVVLYWLIRKAFYLNLLCALIPKVMFILTAIQAFTCNLTSFVLILFKLYRNSWLVRPKKCSAAFWDGALGLSLWLGIYFSLHGSLWTCVYIAVNVRVCMCLWWCICLVRVENVAGGRKGGARSTDARVCACVHACVCMCVCVCACTRVCLCVCVWL